MYLLAVFVQISLSLHVFYVQATGAVKYIE